MDSLNRNLSAVLAYIRTYWKASLSVTFVLIALIDIFVATISPIAATFLGLAALPWLLGLFEKITLPGGIELELRSIEKRLDAAGANPEPEDKYPFQYLQSHDPNLAMAALRIEIEKRLRRIAENVSINTREREIRGIPGLLKLLEKEGAIGQNVSSMIFDMLPTLNAAAHGAVLPHASDEWVFDNGPRLLALLDEKR